MKNTLTITENDIEVLDEVDSILEKRLILWDDDFTSMDLVVMLIITILQYDSIRAEQLMLNIHHTGSATVKSGTLEELKPLKDLFIDGGLSATIE